MARTHTYKPISRNRHTPLQHTQIYARANIYEWNREISAALVSNVMQRGSIEHVLANGRLSKVLDLFPPYPFSFNESYVLRVWIYTRVHTHTHTRDGQHVRHVCAENWIRRGSRGPASVISQSCQGLTLYNVIYKELTMDDRRGDWKLWLYAPRTFLPSLGFFPCNVFLLLIFFFVFFLSYIRGILIILSSRKSWKNIGVKCRR